MASLACGNRLSLRNQYDTKTPRASRPLTACQSAAWQTVFQGGESPVPREAGTCSRHKQRTAWVSKSPPKLFSKKGLEKFSRSSRSTAGLVLRKSSKVLFNLALGREGRKPSEGTVARTWPCGKVGKRAEKKRARKRREMARKGKSARC